MSGLNVVRSGRPEQSTSRPSDPHHARPRLNVVRPGRPEQCVRRWVLERKATKADNVRSQCSPAWKTGTIGDNGGVQIVDQLSQCSPAWKTGTIGCSCTPPTVGTLWSQCSPAWKTGTIWTHQKLFGRPISSQCSPAWKTGTMRASTTWKRRSRSSQCSPAWKTGTIEHRVEACSTQSCVSM